MSVRIIPEQRVYECDRCHSALIDKVFRRKFSFMVVNDTAPDVPPLRDGCQLDLCDHCANMFDHFMSGQLDHVVVPNESAF